MCLTIPPVANRRRFARGSAERPLSPAFADFDDTLDSRRNEADEFYGAFATQHCTMPMPATCSGRRLAGLIWTEQFYHYDVARWLRGRRIATAAAAERESMAATNIGVI